LTRRYDGRDACLWWQRFASDGTPEGSPVRVSAPVDRTPTAPGAEYEEVQTIEDGEAWLDVDALGSARVVWGSSTRHFPPDNALYNRRVQWRRVDPDGSLSVPVLLNGDDWWTRWVVRLDTAGTTWVIPESRAGVGGDGLIGVRVDGSALPTVRLARRGRKFGNPEYVEDVGLDVSVGVHVAYRTASDRRDSPLLWGSFTPDATPVQSRVFVGRSTRTAVSGYVAGREFAVAPDGSSLLGRVRRQTGADRVEFGFAHLASNGRVIARGGFTPAYRVYPSFTAAQVDGRPQFAIAWVQRTDPTAPLQAFVAILE
jgi:hypothetical protein